MNSFVQHITNTTETENGCPTYKSTLNKCLDLFFIGASTDLQNAKTLFISAYKEDKITALKVAFYLRDVRDGQGKRDVIRAMLSHLIQTDTDTLNKILPYLPSIGRWKDVFENVELYHETTLQVLRGMIEIEKDTISLMCKWMPRKGKPAVILRQLLNLSPKEYRKFVVINTQVVETLMCANKWEDIDFSKLPSIAGKNYQNAFSNHCKESYEQFKEKLVKGETKINASTLYPHNIVSNLCCEVGDKVVLEQSWKSLPDYMEGSEKFNILPIIDTSSSMNHIAYGTTSAMHISIGLGIYLSERNRGTFKDLWCNFSSTPSFYQLEGDSIAEKIANLDYHNWGGSTNIQAVFDLMLKVSVANKVPEEDMPKVVLIISDMEFDEGIEGKVAYSQISDMYLVYGYKLPTIVFWNVCARNTNMPIRMMDNGIGISGYSPIIMKEILKGNLTNITPMLFMEDVIKERYNFLNTLSIV